MFFRHIRERDQITPVDTNVVIYVSALVSVLGLIFVSANLFLKYYAPPSKYYYSQANHLTHHLLLPPSPHVGLHP